MASIASALSESGAKYARRALEAYVTEQLDDFYLFAGIAVEHAVKAKLARVSPLFLAPSRDGFKSAVALHLSDGEVEKLPATVTTVRPSEAVDRLGQLYPNLKAVLSDTNEIMELRNGQAHMGTVDPTRKRRNVVMFLKAINALLQIDPGEFWSPHGYLVESLLNEDSAETTQRAMQAVAAASIVFETRTRGMAPEVRQAWIDSIDHRAESAADHVDSMTTDCPACQSTALAYGDTVQTDWDVIWDDDGDPSNAYPVLTFFAGVLVCEACGLHLSNSEMLEIGIDPSWQNTEIDALAWFTASQPDFDAY